MPHKVTDADGDEHELPDDWPKDCAEALQGQIKDTITWIKTFKCKTYMQHMTTKSQNYDDVILKNAKLEEA